MNAGQFAGLARSARVLVTGADGFVGRCVCRTLAAAAFDVVAAVRGEPSDLQLPRAQYRVIGDLASYSDWSALTAGIDAVVHLAARVHRMGPEAGDDDTYLRHNATPTAALAVAAAAQGVGHFVLMSSVKVNGESTIARPFAVSDVPQPSDAYARSKLAAETALMAVGARTGMPWTIVRSPLVYGPGVRANFLRMMQWVDRGVPLPFGAVTSRRTIVGLENLADLLCAILRTDASHGRVFFAADELDVTVPQLVGMIASAMGRRPRLVRVPPRLLELAGALTGRSAQVQRLTLPLQVDRSAVNDWLGWRAPRTTAEGVAGTVAHYLAGPRAR